MSDNYLSPWAWRSDASAPAPDPLGRPYPEARAYQPPTLPRAIGSSAAGIASDLGASGPNAAWIGDRAQAVSNLLGLVPPVGMVQGAAFAGQGIRDGDWIRAIVGMLGAPGLAAAGNALGRYVGPSVSTEAGMARMLNRAYPGQSAVSSMPPLPPGGHMPTLPARMPAANTNPATRSFWTVE